MDGSHRQIIINNNIKWANGLTLDLVLNRIYWVDAKLNIISSCNFDGSDRRVILYSAEFLRHPFSITTFEDYVYWTDWDKAAVFKANKFNGSEIQAITAMRMVSVYAFFTLNPFRFFFWLLLLLYKLYECMYGNIKYLCRFVKMGLSICRKCLCYI